MISESFILQRFRHVAADDAPRQTFGNRRLAHAGFADEDGIVFGATRQHLHHAADFLVATDDRINLSLTRSRRKIAPILFERLKFSCRSLISHALVAAQVCQRFEHRIALQAVRLKNFLERRIALIHQAEQQVFGADVIILELRRLGLRGIENFFETRAQERFARSLDFVAAGQFAVEIRFEFGNGHADFFQQIGDETFRLANQRQQQMFAINFLMRKFPGDALRPLYRLL